MAGTITHFEIGKRVLKNLNIKLDKDIFLLACQGHDLLYFIKLKDLPKYDIAKEKAKMLQNEKFKELMIKYNEEIKNSNDIKLKSFLYGYITHHITDSIFHPYIIYEAGVHKKTKETLKYKGRHEMLESIIDYKITSDINNVYKEMPKIKDTAMLKEVTKRIFHEVYKDETVGYTLIKNMNNVRGFLWLYRSDKTKIKRIGYKVIDKITGKYYEFLAYNYPRKDLEKVDLAKKEKWYHPVTNEEHVSSILDLYEEAIKKATRYLEKIEAKKIAEIDLDISAETGLKCNKDNILKHFID